MTQPDFAAVRQAVATYLTATVINADGSGLRASTDPFATINPPQALILPQTGRLIAYSQTFDQETDYYLRAVICVSIGDTKTGQDLLDGYLSPVGTTSVYAAIQKDPTLTGAVSYAAVIEATGYGLMNFSSVDYLACSLVLNIGT
jgi:hypothetical protein